MTRVNIFGTLRLVTGTKSLQVNLPGDATLRDLLEEIIRQIPAMRSELIGPDGLRQDLPLFVNGRNPRLLPAAIDTRLEPDDVVSLFSPISSGRMNVEDLRQYGPAEME